MTCFFFQFLLSMSPRVNSLVPQKLSLRLDDYLERLCFGGVPEGLIGIENFIELEVMRDEELGVDLVRCNGLVQHRDSGRVDQPRGDGDIAVPEALKMEIHLFAM